MNKSKKLPNKKQILETIHKEDLLFGASAQEYWDMMEDEDSEDEGDD